MISIIVECAVANKGHRGNDIKDGYSSTAPQCAIDCRLNANCAGSTHDGRKLCWLHYSVEPSKFYDTTGYTLYMKACR